MSAEPQIELLLDFLDEIKPESILEVGVGDGGELNAISDVHKKYGIDKDSSVLNKVDGTTIVADANNIPISDNFIDVVYSMGCLSHNEKTSCIINEMFRVSKNYVVLIEWIGTATSGKTFVNCKKNSWIHDYTRLVSLKGELCYDKKIVYGADLFHVLVLRKRYNIMNKNVINEKKNNPFLQFKLGKFIFKVEKS